MPRISIAILFLLWFSVSAYAADIPVSEHDFAAYKELAQTKLDATKESLQKDREKTEIRLDSQDKRIGDLNFTLTAFGGFLTLLVLVAGGVGWVSVRDRTREETRETAKKWFDDKAGEMEREIAALRQRAQESQDLIEKLKRDAVSHFQSATDDVHEKAAEVMAELQKNISNPSGKTSGEAPLAKDGEALKQLEQAIRNKPEADYNFDDWNTRAFSALYKKDLEGAVRYWKSAADASDATDTQIAQSLFNAGVAFGQMNRSEEEIAIYDEVVKRFGDATEAALREQVATALFNKGFRFGEMNRNEDAVAVYDEVVQRFGGAPEVGLRELVAKALVNKGATFDQMSRRENAIAVYDEIVKRFGDAPEAALREQVAKALFNKGVALGQMNRREDEIAIYEEVVQRFGAAPEAALREQVAKALVNKGVAFSKMSRSEDAVAVYDEIVKRFGAALEAALREQVAKALNGKGFALLCRAKEHWVDETARKVDLKAAVKLFEQATGDIADKPMVWGNQAYVAFLLGQSEDSRPLLLQALQQGGEELYKAELEDIKIHSVPPDEAFRAILEELWAEVKP